ncbi:MAG: alpha-amylase family glycosyl hydrolase, partial [Anaerolineae bacterium]
MRMVEEQIQEHLAFLYGDLEAKRLWPRLRSRLSAFSERRPDLLEVPPPEERLTERDALLITYGDQVRESCKPPLQTLAEVLEHHVEGVISGVHLLPFFPYSSDDGFSVIDYTTVNPTMGTWEEIARLDAHFRLMFDAVINHISRESDWFQGYLEGDPEYEGYFIEVEEGTDLSDVVRPRAKPLLTEVETDRGKRLVWTTFSDDQIDLNFSDPEVLLRIIDVLLFYVAHGAEIIRLDAIAYLWKKMDTSCIHLEETHRVVKLFRAVMDAVAPGVILITETNVPHEENISYFGDGTDEAQLVYQFPLPPLVFHAIATGDATKLTHWAADLEPPSRQTTFFNFVASHDGVGVRPVEGILTPEEVQNLVEITQGHGGYVSYKTNADGSESVYELNISYFDALSDPEG